MIRKRKLIPFVVCLILFGTWLATGVPTHRRVPHRSWYGYISRVVTLGKSHNLYEDTIDLSKLGGAHYFTIPLDDPVAGRANYTEALCHMDREYVVPDLWRHNDLTELMDSLLASPQEIRDQLKTFDEETQVSGQQCLATIYAQTMLVLQLGYFASWGLDSRAHLLGAHPELSTAVKFNDLPFDTFAEGQLAKFVSSEPFTTDHVYTSGEIEKIKHIQVLGLGPGTPNFMLRKTFTFEAIKISLAFGNGTLWKDFTFEPVKRGVEKAGRSKVLFPGYAEDHTETGETPVPSFPHKDALFFGDSCTPLREDVSVLAKVIYAAEESMELYPFDNGAFMLNEAARAWESVKYYDVSGASKKGVADSMCHFAHTRQGEAFNVQLSVGLKCNNNKHSPNLNYFTCQQLH